MGGIAGNRNAQAPYLSAEYDDLNDAIMSDGYGGYETVRRRMEWK